MKIPVRLIAILSLIVLLGTPSVSAKVYSPWIISEHTADTSSMEAFRLDSRWKDKTGQDLALEVWKYLVSQENGVFHYCPIREGDDPVDWEFRMIRDPIKMLNTYGYGFCGAFGPTTAGIFEAIGLDQARSVQVPGCNHNVTEVWYDGSWHYFDTDLRGVLFRRDGQVIASVADVIREPDLWTNPSKKIQPFFPDDPPGLEVYARTFREEPVEYCYRWFMSGSTMDFVLRKGESFTRWWSPQGGRWSHQEDDSRNDWWIDLISKDPYGAKSNHPDFSIWTHGNGLFDYHPNLKSDSSDLDDGVFQKKNVEVTDKGVTVAGSGNGEVVFEVLSPYIIVPLVGDLLTRDDDREASIIDFTSRGRIKVYISLDYGRSFREIAVTEKAGSMKLDLTPHLRERYQYLVKFTLDGPAEKTILESIRIRTWVQVAPASLPRLGKGVNQLSYRLGDKHGLHSLPWLQIPNMGSREEMSRYWSQPPLDYDPERFQERLKGEVELTFTPPPGRTIKWMSLGGFFSTHRGKQATRTANAIWYRTADSREWLQVHGANIPQWHSHWHYSFDQEVVLPKTADQVQVRYVGDPGVNGIRVNLHSVKPEEEPEQSIAVIHGYELDGELKESRFVLDGPTEYSIECPKEPKNIFIRMEMAGD